jgi:hypothetical protein
VNPFLDGLTIIFVLTGVFTAVVTIMIRFLWRRGKGLEDR